MMPLARYKPKAVLVNVVSLASASKTHFLNFLPLLRPNISCAALNLILKPFFDQPAVWLPLTFNPPLTSLKAIDASQLERENVPATSGLDKSLFVAFVAKSAFASALSNVNFKTGNVF